MKQLITLFIGLFYFLNPTLGQVSTIGNNDIKFSIEFNFHQAAISSDFVTEQNKLAFNINGKVYFPLSNNLELTAGVAYLNTGEKEIGPVLFFENLKSIEFIHNYNYLIVPVGINVKAAGFYLNPQIGIGPSLSQKLTIKKVHIDDTVERSTIDEALNSGEFNPIIIPAMISIGKEFKINELTFYAGLNGYYSLTKLVNNVPSKNNAYGYGLSIGLRI